MEYSIRRAQIGDEAALRELRVRALTDAPEAFGSTLEREMARTTEDWRKWISPGATFLLECAGEPCGLVSTRWVAEQPGVAELLAMWVAPELRGSGAAPALIEAVQQWAKAEGGKAVRLGIVAGNDRARKAYERSGFRVVSERQVSACSRECAIEMLCKLMPQSLRG